MSAGLVAACSAGHVSGESSYSARPSRVGLLVELCRTAQSDAWTETGDMLPWAHRPPHPPALAGAAPSPGNAPHTYSLCGRDLTFKERTL